MKEDLGALSYNEAAAQLDEILGTLEEGQIDVDQLSDMVEKAAALVDLCRQKITFAEMKVKKIAEKLERDERDDGGQLEEERGSPPGDDDIPF